MLVTSREVLEDGWDPSQPERKHRAQKCEKWKKMPKKIINHKSVNLLYTL